MGKENDSVDRVSDTIFEKPQIYREHDKDFNRKQGYNNIKKNIKADLEEKILCKSQNIYEDYIRLKEGYILFGLVKL